MAKSKFRKPTKEEVKMFVQLLLMVYMVFEGFFYTYSFVWIQVGLPYAWWALLTTSILGALSTFGLFMWIARN